MLYLFTFELRVFGKQIICFAIACMNKSLAVDNKTATDGDFANRTYKNRSHVHNYISITTSQYPSVESDPLSVTVCH
jgi:hypothetical protein